MTSEKGIGIARSIIILGILLLWGCLWAGADCSHGAEEPDLKAYLSTPYGTATDASPAPARLRSDRYFGFYVTSCSINLTYSGLEPNTGYRRTIKCYNQNGICVSSSTSTGLVTGDTGSGTLTLDEEVWGALTPGEYRLEVGVFKNEGDTPIPVAADGAKAMSFVVSGPSAARFLVDGDTSVEGSMFNIISNEDLEEGRGISYRMEMSGLRPGQTYDLSASLKWLDTSISWYDYRSNAKVVKSGITASAQADDDGNLTFDIPLEVSDLLETGKSYMIGYTVTNAGDSADRYVFNPGFIDTELLFGAFFFDDSFLIVFDTSDKPEETPDSRDIEIANYIKGTETFLEGSVLKLVRGTSPDGEVVDRWTVGKEPHRLRLEVGDYLLIQESVPEGYTIAEPVAFSLKEGEGGVSGSNFVAYERSVKPYGDDQSSVSFYLSKEGDHNGKIAYCVNLGLKNPSLIDFESVKYLYYRELKLEDEEAFALLRNPRLGREETVAALKRVIYAGHPDNGASLKETYGLSAQEFDTVTQAAVHYYTDSAEHTLDGSGGSTQHFNGNTGMYEAYQALINSRTDPPKGLTVKLYAPTSEGYQALVATTFEKEDRVDSLVILNAGPETPTEPEKPEEPTEEPTGPVSHQTPTSPADRAGETTAPASPADRAEGTDAAPERKGSDAGRHDAGADTGDDSHVIRWMLLMFLSAFFAAFLAASAQRFRQR